MPPLLMADEENQLLPVGAEIDLPVAQALSFKNGHPYPSVLLPGEGIDAVIVNGQVVVDQGEHTGALPGQILRKQK